MNQDGPSLMEILYFKDLWDTECHLAVNAVVLVLGKLYCNVLGIDNVMPL